MGRGRRSAPPGCACPPRRVTCVPPHALNQAYLQARAALRVIGGMPAELERRFGSQDGTDFMKLTFERDARAPGRRPRLRSGFGARCVRRGAGVRHRRASRGRRWWTSPSARSRRSGTAAPWTPTGKTGDGAGIMVGRAAGVLRRRRPRSTGHALREGPVAVGQIFLPRTNLAAQEGVPHAGGERGAAREASTSTAGARCRSTRAVVGAKADATRPEIEQIMLAPPPGVAGEALERALFLCRKRIEKRAAQAGLQAFYICSFSAVSLVYKGMFLAEHIDGFYPEPARPAVHLRRGAVPPAILHQHLPRVAPGPAVPRAGAQRRDQHPARQRRLDALPRNPHGSHRLWGRGRRGRQAGDPARRLRLRGAGQRVRDAGARRPLRPDGQDPAHARGRQRGAEPRALRALWLLQRGDGAVGRAGRGRAPSTARWVVAGKDRNGLRPLRTAVTDDGLLVVGSEAGMAGLAETRIRERAPHHRGADDRRRPPRRAGSTARARSSTT